MKQIISLLVLCIAILLSNTHLHAIPAYPYPVIISQPDGTSVTVQLHGDESRKIRTTVDGYVIKMNDHGFYAYAILDENNKLVAGEKSARDPEKRSAEDQVYLKKAKKIQDIITEEAPRRSKIKRIAAESYSTGFPKTGSPKSLVIMVNFSDVSFVVPNAQDAFSRLLNQENYSDNGGTGSAKDYFRAASYGQFSPQFDVVGPYTLPNTMAYYGANDASDNDVKPAYMVVDACSIANNDVDFTQYDADGDGYIDNVFIYYAGHNEAEWGPENSIWPHRWAVQPGYNYSTNPNLVKFDGKIVYDYACTSELRGSTGTNMCGIGTFTHEFGHVIGMPDYYHTTTTEDKNTLNNWSIMDAGGYLNSGRTPPTYSAYDRFYLGWLSPEEIKTPSDRSLYPISQSKVPVESTAKQAYLLSATTHNLNGGNPSPKEFYIMEYRKKTGWDTYLPAEGLLFWHIDYDQTAWDNNTPNNYTGTTQTASSHMRVYLQPLSGYSTTPGTAFTSGSFNPLTWSGSTLNREITSITKTNDSINFKIMGGTYVDPGTLPIIKVGLINELLQFVSTKTGSSSFKQLKIKTTDLSGHLSVILSGTHASLFSVSTPTISMGDANSETGADLNVTYSPNATGSHTAVLTISGGGLNPEKVIELNGESTE
ncbi:MAG: M6 family metalloprotease domain-containing protein [Paludibacter sp.]|nr:M6 family metalloprotease domain-containing protein [Paludibacter sp.]